MTRLGKRHLHELHYHTTLTRKLEETLAGMGRSGRLPGPLWLRRGLEAVSVGCGYVPTPRDHVASSLPSVGFPLARGVSPSAIVAHYLGKAESLGRGRDGLFYFGTAADNMVGTTGHAATHVSVMAGVAFAGRFSKQSNVALALVSEESIATGDFHEGINFAAVKEAPLVVVVVRRQGSVASASLPSGAGVSLIYERAQAYGISAMPADGTDLLQVIQVVETAFERAREGGGPTLIEAAVPEAEPYEQQADALPPPFPGYRASDGSPDGESASTLGDFLRAHRLMTEDEEAEILSRADKAVDEAVRAAESASAPPVETLTEGVYADG